MSWIVLSCTTKEPIQRLRDFEYPEDSLRLGQIFIYQNKSNLAADCLFITQLILKEKGIEYLIEQTRNGIWKEGYRKFRFDKESKSLELAYIFSYQDSIIDPNMFEVSEMTIRESKNITGERYPGLNLLITTDGFLHGEMQVIETFDREEVVQIMGESSEVVVFNTAMIMRSGSKWIPFSSGKSVYHEETFLGKGKGLVRYSSNEPNNSDTTNRVWWELVAIKRLPKSSWPLKSIDFE